MGEQKGGSEHSDLLDGSEQTSSLPSHFTPDERAPGTHWMGCWVSRFGRYDEEELYAPVGSPAFGCVQVYLRLIMFIRFRTQGCRLTSRFARPTGPSGTAGLGKQISALHISL
jgi:hypothetical protein